MDYYGLLFLYYLKGLSGKSVLRLFFNIEVGGTEQLLPENTSTPTTTPILADIQYPDGLRTDQYFTYRETPTTVSNKARIKTIKGQTLKWNQLIQNGNFADTTNWKAESGYSSLSVANNVATVTLNDGSPSPYNPALGPITSPQSIANHKYYVHVEILSPADGTLYDGGGTVTRNVLHYKPISANVWTTFQGIGNAEAEGNVNAYLGLSNASSVLSLGDSLSYRNYMVIDLTQLFGSTLADSIYNMEQSQSGSGVAYFKSLFPLDYYPYNSGSLIPFMGNGIKATGKNLVSLALSPANQQRVAGVTIQSQTNEEFTITSTGSGTYSNLGLFYNLKKGTYTVKFQAEASDSFAPLMTVYGYNGGIGQVVSNSIPRNTARTFTLTEDKMVEFRCFATTTSAVRTVRFYDFQLEFGSTATAYEPYTSSTLSLPISTYFPTGMKQAGTVYDELLPNKAITRIGEVTVDGTNTGIGATALTNVMRITIPIDTAKYNSNQISNNLPFLVSYTGDTEHFYVSDTYIQMFIDKTKCGSTRDSVKQYLSYNPTTIYFELATYTETPITTEDANEALSLLMGKSVSSNNAKQMIDIITKGE